MNKLFLISFAFFIFSCQQQKLQLKTYSHNSTPELEAVVEKFEKIYNTQVNYQVSFVSHETLNPNFSKNTVIAGECQRLSDNSQRQILINQDWWNRQTEYPAFRELTVFHELGHCHFFRDHDNTILENGYPKSIMKSSSEQFLYVYTWFYEYYITELSSSAVIGTFKSENEEVKVISHKTKEDGSCE